MHLSLCALFGYRNCIKILITIVSFIHITHRRSFRDRCITQYFPHAGMTVVSLNLPLSVNIIRNEYDCVNNSRKRIFNTSNNGINACAISTSLILICGGSNLWPCYARRYLPAAISNNLLFVKTSADYIIIKIMHSMHVNFSQSEHSVGTRFNFFV